MASKMLDFAAQIEDWRSRLLDLTKRNRLISCKIGPTAALELFHPDSKSIWERLGGQEAPLVFVWRSKLVNGSDFEDPEGSGVSDDVALPAESGPGLRRITLDECLASPRLEPTHVLTDLSDTKLSSRLKRLSLNAKTSIEEQGVNVLFVTFGLLEWYEAPQSEVPLYSPLLLLPVSLARPGPDESWRLVTYENELVENQCLREMLRSSFRFELPSLSLNETEEGPDPFGFLERVQAYLDERDADDRWRVHLRNLLGTFSFQKIAMWEDLGKNKERVLAHKLCRRIAGDHTAEAFDHGDLPPASTFDERIHPSEIFSVLDSDSSQLEAVIAAKRGASLVIDGPPGTGKSQTIANIIAECLADNKRVLFVSEKSAALEVVKRRLDEKQLGDFCLECHSHKANKKEVLAELARCLQLPVERYQDQSGDLQKLAETRARLNAYVSAIHQPRGALRLTPFQVHGRLAALTPLSQTRASVQDVLGTSRTELDEIVHLLDVLSSCERVFRNYQHHPWRGARTSTFSLLIQDDIRHLFSTLAGALQSTSDDIDALSRHGLIAPTPTIDELEQALLHTQELLAYPVIPRAWFAETPAILADDIEALQLAEQEFVRLREELPEIAEDVPVPTAAWRELLGRLKVDPHWSRVRLSDSATIRSVGRQLEETLGALREFRDSLTGLRTRVDSFSRLLQVRIDGKFNLGVLNKLTTLGLVVADAGPLKPEWFDAGTRADLLRLEADCRPQAEALTTMVEQRRTQWSAEAYSEEGAALADQGVEYEALMARWWAMLTGRWSAFRRNVKHLYLDRPPKEASILLEDLDSLRRYHRRERDMRRIENERRSQLVFDSRGRADWKGLKRGLEAVSRLESLIRVPDKLKHVLSTDGAIERDSLREIAHDIESRLGAIDHLATFIQRDYSLQQIAHNQAGYADVPAEQLVIWLAEAISAVERLKSEISGIARLLRSDADIRVTDFATFVDDLDALVQQEQRVASQRQKLMDVPGIDGGPLAKPQGLSQRDVQAATALRQLLHQYGVFPAEAVVTVICNADVRREVQACHSSLSQQYRRNISGLWKQLGDIFQLQDDVSIGITLEKLAVDDCAQWLHEMCGELDRLREWIEFRQTELRLEELGLHPIVTELLSGQVATDELCPAFLARFYRQWLDAVYWLDPALKDFRVEEHQGLVELFGELDRRSVEGAYKRIRTKLLEDPARPHTGLLNAPAGSELGILLRESSRKRPRMPLRLLFRKIPTVLGRLKPCMMMSPLAVSTYLDAPEIEFDVVIFDEASQVRPYDAIGAIYRGKQLLVAGDQKQLPPTSFFDRMDSDEDYDEASEDEGDESANIAEFESILDVCCSLGMPRKRLRWHYRSRREGLIAFSNQFFYDNELVTFPSALDVEGCSPVSLHYVEQGRWLAGRSGGFNPIEAKEIASLVIKHFEQYPDRSLGVITLNQRHQFAVLDELDRIRRVHPELGEFFREDAPEPFFVKNLENVQGDQRDHIILGVGYGFDSKGKFAMRFGPLNQAGGERRLNVAVTRAQYEMLVVSSVRAEDIDLTRTKSRGAGLLRGYLDFASCGVEAIKRSIVNVGDEEHDSEFEAEVERALRGRGLDVRRQVGCGGYRIDLALVDPKMPGRYVLGIECDGATYHSSATARDRDRLRQEILEGLGWRICRIWSTDWVRAPDRQVERVLQAYAEQLAADGPRPYRTSDSKTNVGLEKPKVKLRRDGARIPVSYFSNIDDVPEEDITAVILEMLRLCGQTTADELVKATARHLGFSRVGHRIQNRIEQSIKLLASRGLVSRGSEGWTVAS